MAETPGRPKQEIKLFYCYAHEDKALRDELQISLAGLKRQYQLVNWYDREILPGEQWEEAIDIHLSTADVILLLISPYFLDSDYCYSKEMQCALERHHGGSCCVIPILLRPTYWEDTPLGTIQLVPTGAKPITSWSNRYKAYYDVAGHISIAIRALLTNRHRKAKEDWLKKGIALNELKRHEEALAAFEQAISLDPNDAVAYRGKGAALRALKRYEEALYTCSPIIRLDPNDPLAYYNKGYMLSKLKRHEEALTAFEQAISLDPNNADAYYGKGLLLFHLRRHSEAFDAFQKARQLGYDGRPNRTNRRQD